MIRLLNENDKYYFNKLIKSAASENMYIVRKKNTYFGYFKDKEIIGIVGFYSFDEQKMIGFVNSFVLPIYRNQGIYKKLSQFRLNYVKKHFKGYSVYVTANDKSKYQLENDGFTFIESQYRMILNL